jgi:hypothetical protein
MSVYLTNIKRIRRVVERMKKMSLKLEVRGSTCGELRFSIETEKACVATYFQDLQVECDTGTSSLFKLIQYISVVDAVTFFLFTNFIFFVAEYYN